MNPVTSAVIDLTEVVYDLDLPKKGMDPIAADREASRISHGRRSGPLSELFSIRWRRGGRFVDGKGLLDLIGGPRDRVHQELEVTER